MAEWIVLDGVLQPLAEARISPLDRGLVFGDGLYEVARVEGFVPLFLERHLERLARGLKRVEIPWPGDLAGACRALLDADPLEEGSLYMQVTRGAGPRSHVPSSDLRPTWLVMPSAQRPQRPGAQRLRAIAIEDPRWLYCDIKSTSLMGTVLGKLAARQARVDEVLFVGPQGELREGGSTSLFVRQGERLWTHPLDGRVLPSITRERVLSACRALGRAVEERAPRLAGCATWDEAFLCGTLTGVQPLVELDGQRIPEGAWTAELGAALAAEQAQLVKRRTLTGGGAA